MMRVQVIGLTVTVYFRGDGSRPDYSCLSGGPLEAHVRLAWPIVLAHSPWPPQMV